MDYANKLSKANAPSSYPRIKEEYSDAGGDMGRFLVGFLLGLATALSLPTLAARLVGDDDFLIGWTVTLEGEAVCSDPYVWLSTREIECSE